MPKNNEIIARIALLYPDLTTEECGEVEENLLRYLGVVLRVFENVRLEKPEILTELGHRARLRKAGKSAYISAFSWPPNH